MKSGAVGRAPESPGFSWQHLLLVGCLLLLAAGLRLWAIAGSPTLSNDEAALAWSIETRGYAGLLRPLEFGQGAPIGFLFLAELIEQTFGQSAAAYRFLPLVFGVLTVGSLAFLASHFTSTRTAIAVALLAATSGSMVQYSAFFKQYAADAFCASLLLIFFSSLIGRTGENRPDRWFWSCFGLAGIAIPWLSHPSVFVFVGGSAVGLYASLRNRRNLEFRLLLIVFLAFGSSFGIHYFCFTRHLNESRFLREFWGPQMLPDPISALGTLKWVLRSALDWSATSFGLSPDSLAGRSTTALSLPLALLGGFQLWKRDRLMVCLLLAPAALTGLAACLRMYPFSGRLILFLVPSFLILTTVGLTRVLRRQGLAIAVMASVALLLLTAWLRPHSSDLTRQNFAEACRGIAPRLGGNDHVYIFYPNRVICFYSLVHAGVAPDSITAGAGDSPGAFEAVHHIRRELSDIPKRTWENVWVAQSHPRLRDGIDEGDVVLDHFRRHCAETLRESRGLAQVTRFSCNQQSALTVDTKTKP